MNVFLIEADSALVGVGLDDKRCFKQALEGVQILSTVVNEHLGGVILKDDGEPVKSTHKNHPCIKWAAQSGSAFRLLYNISVHCLIEHRYRFGTTSKLKTPLAQLKEFRYAIESDVVNYPVCLPDEYKNQLLGIPPTSPYSNDLNKVVKAYRHYCAYQKQMANYKYTKRVQPLWLRDTSLISDVGNVVPF